jgi:hypothetical protein
VEYQEVGGAVSIYRCVPFYPAIAQTKLQKEHNITERLIQTMLIMVIVVAIGALAWDVVKTG